jgi:hypothetical protein
MSSKICPNCETVGIKHDLVGIIEKKVGIRPQIVGIALHNAQLRSQKFEFQSGNIDISIKKTNISIK